MTIPLPGFVARVAGLVEPILAEELDRVTPPGLRDAVRYAVLGGGKRLRPAVAAVAGAVIDGEGSRALPLAAAIELFHASTLIHDDLPALDDDDERRGRPSCHRAFGEAVALLAGDALMLLPFEVLARGGYPAELLGMFAGATGQVVWGQAREVLVARGEEPGDQGSLEAIHRAKTASLFELAAAGGALACGAAQPVVSLMSAFGLVMGRLFQLTDDILDATDPDDYERRINLALLMGERAARAAVETMVGEAMAALDELRSVVPHPLGLDELAALIRFVRDRVQ